MSERNQTVVILIVALLVGAFVDRITALKITAGVVLAVVTAEPTSGLGRYPEAVLACAATAFGPGISR